MRGYGKKIARKARRKLRKAQGRLSRKARKRGLRGKKQVRPTADKKPFAPDSPRLRDPRHPGWK